MKKKAISIIVLSAALIWGGGAFAADHGGHDMEHEGHASDSMEHSMPAGTFTHHMAKDGIRAEFQVMSLESMNMKDPEGASHHIMVELSHEGMDHPVEDAVGRIKVIGPDNSEQIADLKNYSGILAANFTFDQAGKYGVICLVKIGGEKHVFKYWYPHEN